MLAKPGNYVTFVKALFGGRELKSNFCPIRGACAAIKQPESSPVAVQHVCKAERNGRRLLEVLSNCLSSEALIIQLQVYCRSRYNRAKLAQVMFTVTGLNQ